MEPNWLTVSVWRSEARVVARPTLWGVANHGIDSACKE